MSEQILKIAEAAQRYKLSISTIYRLSAENKFPIIIKLGKRSSGVLESHCEQWLKDRISDSRNEKIEL